MVLLAPFHLEAGQETDISLICIPGVSNLYHYFLYVTIVVTTNAGTNGPQSLGELESVSESGTNLQFYPVVDSALFKVDEIDTSPALDALTETLTLNWTNFTTNFTETLNPATVLQPQSQSFRLGSNVFLNAEVGHVTAVQWQKNGTNLVNDAHIQGVTTTSLSISNAQADDEGNYALSLANPATPFAINGPSTLPATLSVFKPLSVFVAPIPYGFALTVANRDQSAVDSFEVANLILETTSNLDDTLSLWESEDANLDSGPYYAFGTNGLYEVDYYPDDNSPWRFWRFREK